MIKRKEPSQDPDLLWMIELSQHESTVKLQTISISCSEIERENKGKKVRFIDVSIDNIDKLSENIVQIVQDTSWMSDLLHPELTQEGLKAASKRTLDKLIPILEKFRNEESPDNKTVRQFGEYALSLCSQGALSRIYKHKVFPLSEIIKSKASGNDGYDFHTLTSSRLIVYGESKYRSKYNGYDEAIQQVEKFIIDNKHKIDNLILCHFEKEGVKNSNKDNYEIAISFNVKNNSSQDFHNQIIEKVNKRTQISKKDLYVIGVVSHGFF